MDCRISGLVFLEIKNLTTNLSSSSFFNPSKFQKNIFYSEKDFQSLDFTIKFLDKKTKN